jgi:hypothetical protein
VSERARPSAPAAAELLVTTPRDGLWRLEGPHAREVARLLLRQRPGDVTLREMIGLSGATLIVVGWLLYLFANARDDVPFWTVFGGALWLASVAVHGVQRAALRRELRLSVRELRALEEALTEHIPAYQPGGVQQQDGQLERVPERLDEERVLAAIEDARRRVDGQWTPAPPPTDQTIKA